MITATLPFVKAPKVSSLPKVVAAHDKIAPLIEMVTVDGRKLDRVMYADSKTGFAIEVEGLNRFLDPVITVHKGSVEIHWVKGAESAWEAMNPKVVRGNHGKV